MGVETVIDENKLSIFRRYFLEVSLIILTASLGFTVNFVISLNNNFFKYVLDDKQATTIQLQKSTEAINNNTESMKNLRDTREELLKRLINNQKK